MKRLHLLILRSFIGPFVLIFFIVLFVLLMQFLWRYIDELIGKGLESKTILEFLLYTSATLVPMALPLSILMSSLMTFGNLGENYELTAIKASGISLQKVMRPLILSVFLISIGAFFFANEVLPYANLQMRSLLYDIRQQRPEFQLKPGEFNSLITGYSIRIDSKDPKTNLMYGVQIYDHTEGKGNVSVVIADSGSILMTDDKRNLIMTLYSGHSYNELQEENRPKRTRSYPHRYDNFEKQEILIELTEFDFERTDQNLFRNHYAMQDLRQLTYNTDSLKQAIDQKENEIYLQLSRYNLFKKRQKTDSKYRPAPKLSSITKAELEDLRDTGSDQYDDEQKIENSEEQVTGNPDTTLPVPQDEVDTTTASPPEMELAEIPTIDTDSVLNLLTLNEKKRISLTALNNARTSKNIVTNTLQNIDYKIHSLRRHEIEWQRKFTIAFACMLFLFIGAPLGAIIRKGGLGLPLVLSVLFFILYYILSLTGEKLVRESIVTDYQGMWMTSAIFAVTGGFLTYQATTDSSMLNIDTYLNFLKRLFGQRYNVVDKLSVTANIDTSTKAKIGHIKSSLVTLQDNVNHVLEQRKNENQLSKISQTLLSVYSLAIDDNLVHFEKYYNNSFRIIINHPVFHNSNIRGKVYQFPSFNSYDYIDKGWKKVLRITLACTPALVLVWIREAIKRYFLLAKLKKVQELIPELLSLLNINFPENIDENTSTLQ